MQNANLLELPSHRDLIQINVYLQGELPGPEVAEVAGERGHDRDGVKAVEAVPVAVDGGG